MLDELRRITSTQPYKSSGSMRVKEVLITPWESQDTRLVIELWTDDFDNDVSQVWEVTCHKLAQTDGIPLAIIPCTELKLYQDHPVLWRFSDEIYFTITSKADNISQLMGDLFIAHQNICGNWVDFHWLYSSLPETLATLRSNQLAIPVQLKDACFRVLSNHGVGYQINSIQKSERIYQVLFFSKQEVWPDKENFSQSYIIAESFSERRIAP